MQDNVIPDDWADLNLQQVETECGQISSLMMRAGKLKSNAKRAVGEAKVELAQAETALEEIEGLLYLEFRESLDGGTDSKGKPKLPTEGTINSALRTDDRWKAAKQDVLDCELAVVDAQHAYDLCWEGLEALKAKKDMLTNISADRRAEFKSLSI